MDNRYDQVVHIFLTILPVSTIYTYYTLIKVEPLKNNARNVFKIQLYGGKRAFDAALI